MTKRLLGILFMVCFSTAAQAHFKMLSPASRDPDGSGQTNPPCGNFPAGNATVLTPGSTLNVQWNNFIAHPGTFRISLATDQNDFTQHVLDSNIKSIDALGDQNQTITLPTTPCPQCILQLVQVNTSGKDPSTPSGYVEYVSCADLTIGTPATGGSTGTTPTSSDGSGTTTGSSQAPDGTTGTSSTGGATTGASTAGDSGGNSGGCQAAQSSLWVVSGIAVAFLAMRKRRLG